MMQPIWTSAAAMPNSSMWWPLILSGLWAFIIMWPRYDGGHIPYSLGLVAPGWFTLGPIIAVWVIWAATVVALG
jgi:hypothetical protein